MLLPRDLLEDRRELGLELLPFPFPFGPFSMDRNLQRVRVRLQPALGGGRVALRLLSGGRGVQRRRELAAAVRQERELVRRLPSVLRRLACGGESGGARDFELEHLSLVRELVQVAFDLVDLLEFSLQDRQLLLRLPQLGVDVRHAALGLFLRPVQRVDLLLLSLERDLRLFDQSQS